MTDNDKTTRTTCPYCGVGCGVLATRREDGTVTVAGDPHHPANFGRLCSKGSALGETLSLDDRLLYPEIAGKRSDWDTALDLVAGKFTEAIRDHGPDSVAFYVSGQILTEDYYVANKLMKGFIGSANIDTNSRLCMASSVAGHRRAFGTDTVPGTYEDLELADLVVLVGSNLAWCHPVLFQRLEAAKASNPALRVVVIDPRRTATCAIADLHLALKPDTDVALFNGLLSFLAESNALNKIYINRFTEGFHKSLEIAGPCEIGAIAEATGLERRDIALFYKMVARTEKTVTVYSQGVNQSVAGTDKVNAIINTHLATGRIGKPGMGPFSVTGQPNAMGGREVGGLANMLAGHMELENAHHRRVVKDFWQSPVIADKPGLKAVDLFKAVGAGRIKALWIMATSPVDSLPDADSVAEALRVCPFVVVSEVTRTADTVPFADVLLPAAAWGEKDGTVTNSERRISRQRPFLELPGEARPDWWQMNEAARKMGFGEAFSYGNAAGIFREHAALSDYRNGGSRDFDIGAYKDVSDTHYDSLPPFQWPQAAESPPADTRFFSNGGFFTEGRKGRFVPVAFQAPRRRERAYPFILNTGRVRDQWHTMTRTAKTARLMSHIAEPFAEIHPDDAARLGIAAAELVEVKSPHGSVIVRALLTPRVRKGEVYVPMHWTDQFASRARIDAVVAPETDPHSGQPGSKFTPVAVSRVSMAWFGFAVLRERPSEIRADYWAIAPIEGGYRLEFAGRIKPDFQTVSASLGSFGDDRICIEDAAERLSRQAYWDGDLLQAAFFFSAGPVEVSRQWACGLLAAAPGRKDLRSQILAGRAPADRPDCGAIVCSCFQVGCNQITEAARCGADSVMAIGETLQAGTNCGSCRSEIQTLLDEIAKENVNDTDIAQAG
ncbi:nitrate reductase [Roseibium marinum]|uniref:Assimilatory nitrate reductase catalytic subunit n=1 Tax=Roseibium marinum TaxID=281252 RepID=A0A2S3UV50_9HYPH|nr:nitrate reductase [Roseibium marinum]POF31602.1 assimilatory nitrate reductase catalytic subunit [Roseibium marinum]